MFDMTKVKTFKLEDLHGRVIKIIKTESRERMPRKRDCYQHSVTMAFDVNTGEAFVLQAVTESMYTDPQTVTEQPE